MDFDQVNRDHPIDEVLRTYGISVRAGAFRCPFHDDATASGSVFTDGRGRRRWKCHVCEMKASDSLDFVQRKEGVDAREAYRLLTGNEFFPHPGERPALNPSYIPKPELDLIPFPRAALEEIQPGVETPPIMHRSGKARTYKPVLVHRYGDQLIVIRVEHNDAETGKRDKHFIQISYDSRHGFFACGWHGREKRLYREEQLRLHPDKPVLIVEGEKSVDLLAMDAHFDDHVVITWCGGCKSYAQDPWHLLRGRKVVLWPDADLPKGDAEHGSGVMAMLQIAKLCQPAEVRILYPPQEWIWDPQSKGYDAYDAYAEHGAAQARRFIDSLSVPFVSEVETKLTTDENGEEVPYLRSKKDEIAPKEVTNWQTFIERDPRFRHKLSFDIFTREILLDGLPLDEQTGQVGRIAHELGQIGGFRGLNVTTIGKLLLQEARKTHVNRLADELRALRWDGIHRDLMKYAGGNVNDPWPRVAGKRWLIGLVRRVIEPGCKHDGVLILEGKQGLGKSRFFETVGTIGGRNLYAELSRLSQDKDVQLKLQNKVVVELGEMTAHRSGESDAIKAMLSACYDRVRVPYGKESEDFPRTCVFGGSTNEERYLKDMTGNRRFWIIAVDRPVDIAGLERDLPQLLAEAVHCLDAGQPNWLLPEEEEMQEKVAAEREVEWPQFVHLLEILDRCEQGVEYSRARMWELTEIPNGQRSKALEAGLTQTLKHAGWLYKTSSKARFWRKA
jgi:hypothetical protein